MTNGSDEREYRHHDDEDFIEAIKAGNRGTTDIAEFVGVKRQSADERLRKLRDEGRVESEMVGNSLAWSVAQE